MRVAAFFGKVALFLAGLAFITGISLFVVGGFLTTWPIMRVSPRSRRTKALVGLGVAAIALARAYDLVPAEENDASLP